MENTLLLKRREGGRMASTKFPVEVQSKHVSKKEEGVPTSTLRRERTCLPSATPFPEGNRKLKTRIKEGKISPPKKKEAR